MHETQTPLLGPGAAVCAWAGVVVALNLTDNPLVAAGAFAGLALLALRLGRSRLVLVSLAIGLSLSAIAVAVAVLQGTALALGVGSPVLVALATLRVPAQVLGIVLLAAAGATPMLHALARVSHTGAMLAALATRMASGMTRDVAVVREALQVRGLSFHRHDGLSRRAAAWLAVWDAFVAGVCDRAFATAAALDTRAYGARRMTVDPLRHPRLPGQAMSAPLLSSAIAASLSASLVMSIVVARTSQWLPAPTFDPLMAGASIVSPLAWSLALIAFAIGATPTIVRRARYTAPQLVSRTPGRNTVDPRTSRVVLEVRDITVWYPQAARHALKFDSLRVHGGELVVVAGAAGSGKSTLLDCISGLMPYSIGGKVHGSVFVDGIDCSLRPARHRAGRVALVAQHPERQVLVGSVTEEVALGPRNLALAGEAVARRVVESLDAVGALHLAPRRCDTLSAGELQSVMLAAALALEPSVLLLDEPTAQLDAAAATRFWLAVDELRTTRQLGVVAAEHLLDEPLRHCDQLLHLDDGAIVRGMSRDEAISSRHLSAAETFRGLPVPCVAEGAPVRLRLAGLEVAAPGAHGRVLARDLDAHLQAGAVVVVEGDNGVGKTTLLRAIRGLSPVRGTVHVDGARTGGVHQSATRVAWLGQHAAASLWGSSARECLRGPRGGPQLREVDIDRCLAHAGLAHLADVHPMDMSVGERQRLAIAAATSFGQPVWLLDEPTRGLDATGRRWLALNVLTHAARGGVCVLATHDRSLAAAVATHRLRMGDPQPLLRAADRQQVQAGIVAEVST